MEALERTHVAQTDEEVNDGVSRARISLRAPLVPIPPAPAPPKQDRDPENGISF